MIIPCEAKTAEDIADRAAKMLISGNLSEESMEKLILEHLKEIESYYTVIKDPRNGKLSVKIDLGSGGKVLKVEAGIDEINNRVLKSCIINLVKGWTLPASSEWKTGFCRGSSCFQHLNPI